MCLSWLKNKLQRKRTQKEIETKILADYKKQVTRTGRIVTTNHGGQKMPRYQPCPDCHGSKLRDVKTEDGAYYICSKHGLFFVRRARRRPHIPVAQHSK